MRRADAGRQVSEARGSRALTIDNNVTAEEIRKAARLDFLSRKVKRKFNSNRWCNPSLRPTLIRISFTPKKPVRTTLPYSDTGVSDFFSDRIFIRIEKKKKILPREIIRITKLLKGEKKPIRYTS